MAGKKQITKKTAQPVTQPVVEPVTQPVVETKSEPVVETEPVTHVESASEPVSHFDAAKQLPKSGRTLLIKTKTTEPLVLSKFDNFDGLVSKSEINQHNSLFLTFDSLAHAETAYNLIKSEYNVKYSYYKIFFTLSTNIDTSNYEDTKNQIMTFIESKTNASMLYCKFYRKNSSYMNCGDLIVDTIDAMKLLISKESSLKQFKIGNLSGTFYRFNNIKYKTPDSSQHMDH
jgi:hypothetical protein